MYAHDWNKKKGTSAEQLSMLSPTGNLKTSK
jgi:hypothetical protein